MILYNIYDRLNSDLLKKIYRCKHKLKYKARVNIEIDSLDILKRINENTYDSEAVNVG